MRKRFISIISLLAIPLAIIIPSCGKDDCLDLAALNNLKSELEEWPPDTSLHNNTFRDQNNIRQTLVLTYYNEHHFEIVVEDDCGNTYGSWDYSAFYSMSVSPLNFLVFIRGSGIEEDGFCIEIDCIRTLGEWKMQKSVYDLKTDESRSDNVVINYLDEMVVDGMVYNGVLEIIFNKVDPPNGLETIYFSKRNGILKFTDGSGNQFVRENNGQ